MSVYVCVERDIECGDRAAGWCASCPKRTPSDAAELAAFRLWKEWRDEDKRTSGRWCLTPNGLVLGLADVDAAFEAEIHRVSHLEYASDDICRWFFSNVRSRLAALIQPQDDLARSSSEAHAAQARQRSLPLDEALDHLQGLVAFAYAQGFHELGYDPLTVVREDLRDTTAEVERLQRALCFWLPGVPADDEDIAERAGADAFLLIGYEGEAEPSAEDRGWVSLRKSEAQEHADFEAWMLEWFEDCDTGEEPPIRWLPLHHVYTDAQVHSHWKTWLARAAIAESRPVPQPPHGGSGSEEA